MALPAFGARLRSALTARGPLCVGIDPHPSLLLDWGLSDDVTGLRRFSEIVVDALAGSVAVLKPQSAFYERFGSAGIAVLEATIVRARAAGALVIADVKRGDIGSTATAYATAYLDPASPLFADAMTASPYLGVGALAPLVETALEHGTGVFVLALTSNLEGRTVQYAHVDDGRTVAQAVMDEIAIINQGVTPMGSIGVVVGATVGETDHTMSTMNGPLLAPGIGAQGAAPSDLRTVFGAALPAVIPTVSRGILTAGPDAQALKAAAESELAACRRALVSANSLS